MTVRLSGAGLGGTPWSDGNILLGSDLNETLDAILMYRKKYTNASEVTYTGTNSGLMGSFVFGTSGALIIGMEVMTQFKQIPTTATEADVGFAISGANTGIRYIQAVEQYWTGSGATKQITHVLGSTFLSDNPNNSLATIHTERTGYSTYGVSLAPSFKIADNNVALMIYGMMTGAGSLFISGMTVNINYVKSYKEG